PTSWALDRMRASLRYLPSSKQRSACVPSTSPHACPRNLTHHGTLPIRTLCSLDSVRPYHIHHQRRTTMGLFSKDIETMDDLFVHTLRDMYYAEKKIVQSLPEMIEKAVDPQLKQGFETHLAETKNQVNRLERVFEMHGKEASGVDCPAIDGIIEEAD